MKKKEDHSQEKIPKEKKVRAGVSEIKKKRVSELSELIKNNKTILIASIKNLPSSKYQEITKKLRGKAIVKLPKKSSILFVLKNLDKNLADKLKNIIEEGTIFLFSNVDAFELSAELTENKIATKAKAGQEAPTDIEIPAGPTDLVPGPAISELGALEIPIQIEKGKIVIKEPKVIVKKGEKIKPHVAEIMNKLGIKPFYVGFIPLAAYDTKEKKLYLEVKVDREEVIKNLRDALQQVFSLAIVISYISEETIKFLIGKAFLEASTIQKKVQLEN